MKPTLNTEASLNTEARLSDEANAVNAGVPAGLPKLGAAEATDRPHILMRRAARRARRQAR